MPLRGSASCSTFDVSTRKVPSLALVPRGHLPHATRSKKKVAGSFQLASESRSHQTTQDEAVPRSEDIIAANSSSPPRPARRQLLGDGLDGVAEETSVPRHLEPSPGRHQSDIKEDQDGEEDEISSDDDDGQAELRLGERFLNMMALMARLASQSLGDNPAATSPESPGRLKRSNTERTLAFGRTNTERTLSPVASALAPSPPPQQQEQPQQLVAKSPPKLPKHAVREVAERLPHALQGQLTFDICMLLPAPLNDRQSPLRSPIRRKRLRKRVRRRRLRRRARRTWQASHASWPPHASADYIVDHSRQDIAGASAVHLIELLGERKVNAHVLPRVLSMSLPPLHSNNRHIQLAEVSDAAAEHEDEGVGQDDEFESEEQDNECESDEEEQDTDSDESNSLGQEQTSLPSNDTAATLSPQVENGLETHTTATKARKRPLYHQPAWISPELHAWLVASGLFATKPRRELLSTGP